MKKADAESRKPDCTVVCLIPSQTDTDWWHDYAMKAAEIGSSGVVSPSRERSMRRRFRIVLWSCGPTRRARLS